MFHQVRFGINVWCVIYNNKLIGPIFYDGILTGAWRLQLLQNVMPNFLENIPVFYLRNVWFQHDRTTCSQDIFSEAVSHHRIREPNNWVWQFRRMASMSA